MAPVVDTHCGPFFGQSVRFRVSLCFGGVGGLGSRHSGAGAGARSTVDEYTISCHLHATEHDQVAIKVTEYPQVII